MITSGILRTYPERQDKRRVPIEFKKPILNSDFFLRYLHRDAEASSYIVKRLGIDKTTTHLASHKEGFPTIKTSMIELTLTTQLLDTNLEYYIESHPQGLSLEKTGAITRKILKALDFLDQSSVIYPNLTPKSILLSSDGETVRLTHFEQAHFNDAPHSPSNHQLDTSYRSPESLLGNPYTSASNIWALGLIVNQMFTRTFYESETKKNVIASHQFLFETPYPEDLVKESPDKERTYSNSLSIDTGLTETLEQTVRRVSALKGEDREKTEEFLSLLLELFKYTDRPAARDILGHPFFKRFTSEEIEIEPPQIEKKINLNNGKWERELGSGSFGYVWEGTFEGKAYAVKINNKEKTTSKENLLHEDRLLRLLHKNPEAKPYIVERFEIVKSRDNYIWLFLERLGGNLHSYIKRHPPGLSLEKTKQFAQQILKGLQVLSDAEIIHLDLKPENILISLDGESLKIADFGSACFKDKACHPDSFYKQSRWWRSPEDILEIPFTTASDIWSFGAIIPEMLVGQPLFEGKSEIEMIAYHKRRLQKQYPLDLVHQGSQKGQRKVQIALNTIPQDFKSLLIGSNLIVFNSLKTKIKRLEESIEKTEALINNHTNAHIAHLQTHSNPNLPKLLSKNHLDQSLDSQRRTLGETKDKLIEIETMTENLNSILRQVPDQKQHELLIDFVQKALEYIPSKRMNPEQLLEHPFLKNGVV